MYFEEYFLKEYKARAYAKGYKFPCDIGQQMSDEEWHRELMPAQKEQYPEKMKGGHIASVRRVADKFSPRVSFDKRDGWGAVKVDTLKNVDIRSIEGEQVMPNVKGMGLRDAVYMLESRGLTVRFSGAGMVQSQSIPAGQKIKSGESVTLTLK